MSTSDLTVLLIAVFAVAILYFVSRVMRNPRGSSARREGRREHGDTTGHIDYVGFPLTDHSTHHSSSVGEPNYSSDAGGAWDASAGSGGYESSSGGDFSGGGDFGGGGAGGDFGGGDSGGGGGGDGGGGGGGGE